MIVVHSEEPQFVVEEHSIEPDNAISVTEIEQVEITKYVEEEIDEVEVPEVVENDLTEIEITEIPATELPDIPYKESYITYPEIGLDEELQLFTQQKCDEYEVSYPFILALMESESTFRKDIGSEKVLGGEEGQARYYGYMQLSASNCNKAKEYGLDAHTPKGNIEMGILLISKYVKKYDSIEGVITAYKSGEGAADGGKRLNCNHLIERMEYFSEIVN